MLTPQTPNVSVNRTSPPTLSRATSSTSGCKDLHGFFRDVFAGYYNNSPSSCQQSTNRYRECFMCPFAAEEKRFSLAHHFHSAHIRPAMSKLLLESSRSISALELTILMHHASINHIRRQPSHITLDQLGLAKERSQFHWKHRGYSRSRLVLRPSSKEFPNIYKAMIKQARGELERDWIQMKMDQRAKAENWKARLMTPEALLNPSKSGVDELESRAMRDIVHELNMAESKMQFMAKARETLKMPKTRGDGQSWLLVTYQAIHPARKAAGAGELPNWGPHLMQGSSMSSGL